MSIYHKECGIYRENGEFRSARLAVLNSALWEVTQCMMPRKLCWGMEFRDSW